MKRPFFVPRWLALFLTLCLALPSPVVALRGQAAQEASALKELNASVHLDSPAPAAGAEEDEQEPEPGLAPGERHAAQSRYRLLPEGIVVEHDPARSVPCALGHPPLLFRVRVIDTATGQPVYIGTGCCQTLFGVTPSEISAAQTAAKHRRDLVAKYAPILGSTPEVKAILQAVREEKLPPDQWRRIDTLLAALDSRYGVPIAEIDRMAGELPARLLPRLTQAGLLSLLETHILGGVFEKLSASVVQNVPSLEEIRTLRTVHARLARHPAFLQIRTLRSWARKEAATPMTRDELVREEPRTPIFAANLWVASQLLPGIRAGAITHVFEGGSGQEPLYRILEQIGGEAAAHVVMGGELDADTFSTQRNPQRLHLDITNLANPLTPPNEETRSAAELLSRGESMDAAAYVYVLDQLRTPAQQKQAMSEATRVVRLNGQLFILLPVGKELSPSYLDALQQLGWARRPGFPAEIPRMDQRGLTDALKAAHRQRLNAEGIPEEEINRILEIEDRFFSKPSYAVVFDKTAPYQPRRIQAVPAKRFVLMDVTGERRGQALLSKRPVLNAHFLEAVLLAMSVTPDQLAIQASPYELKEQLRLSIHPDFEQHLELLERYLPLLPRRAVAGRPRAQAEVRRLLTLWYDPALATFNEDDARWLETVCRERIVSRLFDPDAAYSVDQMTEIFPGLLQQSDQVGDVVRFGEQDYGPALSFRDALREGRRIALGQLDDHFKRYQHHLGMPVEQADRWYRQQHPPQPPYEMIPTTLQGHLLVIRTCAVDAAEKGRAFRCLQHLENPAYRWTPEELTAIHDDFLEAMQRDTQGGTRWSGLRRWDLKKILQGIRGRLNARLSVNQKVIQKENNPLLLAVRRRRGLDWYDALIIAGLSSEEAAEIRRSGLRQRGTHAAATRGHRVWSRENIAEVIRRRHEAGESLLQASFPVGAVSAAQREWESWEAALADILGISMDEVTLLLERQRAESRREGIQSAAAGRGLQTWSRDTFASMIRGRYASGELLTTTAVQKAGYAAGVNFAKAEWGSWEAALAEVLGLPLEDVKGMLEHYERQSRKEAGLATAAARGDRVWTREMFAALIRERHAAGESLLENVVSGGSSIPFAKREWRSWEAALADILQLPRERVEALLREQRKEAHRRAIEKARATQRARKSESKESGETTSAGMEEWFSPLPPEEARRRMEKFLQALPKGRKEAGGYQDGAIVDLRGLPPQMRVVFVGDMHGYGGILERVLKLEEMTDGKTILVNTGDATDREDEENWGEADSSIGLDQRLQELKIRYPGRFYYLLGNHDRPTLTVRRSRAKDSFPVGQHYLRCLEERYGAAYMEGRREFLRNSPILVIGDGFAAVHAGPIRGAALDRIRDADVASVLKPQGEMDSIVDQAVNGPDYSSLDGLKEFFRNLGLPLDGETVLITSHYHNPGEWWHWKKSAELQEPAFLNKVHNIYAGFRSRFGRWGYARYQNGLLEFLHYNNSVLENVEKYQVSRPIQPAGLEEGKVAIAGEWRTEEAIPRIEKINQQEVALSGRGAPDAGFGSPGRSALPLLPETEQTLRTPARFPSLSPLGFQPPDDHSRTEVEGQPKDNRGSRAGEPDKVFTTLGGQLRLPTHPKNKHTTAISSHQTQTGPSTRPAAGLEEEETVAIRSKYGTRPYAIGARVGGNHIAAGLVNRDGEVELRTALPEINWRRMIFGDVPGLDDRVAELVKKGGPEAKECADRITSEVVRHVTSVVKNTGLDPKHLHHVHIAFGGSVDEQTGVTGPQSIAANLPGFHFYPLAQAVQQGVYRELGVTVPIQIRHDITACMIGETSSFGTAPGAKDVVVFIWGTGINANARRDGRPFTGDSSFAEIGYALVGRQWADGKWHYQFRGPKLRGRRGDLKAGERDLEQRLAGGVLEAWFKSKGYREGGPELAYKARGDNPDVEERNAARGVIVEVGNEMGRAIAALMAFYLKSYGFVPDRFVLGSGVAENFARGLQDDRGRDLLIAAIQGGAYGELRRRFKVSHSSASRIVESIVRSKTDYRRELAAAAAGFPTAGAEEGAQVVPVEELYRRAAELKGTVPELVKEVLLLPAGGVSAKPESQEVILYVHPTVAMAASLLLPDQWAGKIERIPLDDPESANSLLDQARGSFRNGKPVLIALDARFTQGLRMEALPLTFLLDPQRWGRLMDELVSGKIRAEMDSLFLLPRSMLLNRILDLTAGSVRREKIQGKDWILIYV